MKRSTRWVLEISVVLSVGATVWFAAVSRAYVRRAHQISTFAYMQTVSARIDKLIGSGKTSESELLAAVRSVRGGRDAWGNDFVLEIRSKGRTLTLEYVLISRGSDGTLDLPSAASYFSLAECDVRGQFTRDLVFRSGQPVVSAGK